MNHSSFFFSYYIDIFLTFNVLMTHFIAVVIFILNLSFSVTLIAMEEANENTRINSDQAATVSHLIMPFGILNQQQPQSHTTTSCPDCHCCFIIHTHGDSNGDCLDCEGCEDICSNIFKLCANAFCCLINALLVD